MRTKPHLNLGVFAILCGVLLCTSVDAQPVATQSDATACDWLAAHPLDPDRIVAGVPTSQVDLAAAISACEAALKDDPENPRLTYQLARVYFYDDRTADAVRTITRAAQAGHRQAQFVLGALIANRRPDAPTNVCEAEHWWALSAKAGRAAAEVAYVRHATKGLFADCTVGATADDMLVFLDSAAEKDSNYYLKLLIEDLREDLANDTEAH